MRRNSGSRVIRGGQRKLRPMEWRSANISVDNSGANQAASTWAILPSFLEQHYVDPTVMASRLSGAFRLSNTALNGGILYAGAIVWAPTDDSDGIPVPGPTPVDGSHDWLVRLAYPVPANTPAGTAIFPSLDTMYLSQARRRIPSGHSILVVTFGTVGNFSAALDYRYLLKE